MSIKIMHYLRGAVALITPTFIFRLKLKKVLKRIQKYNSKDIYNRVNYYNKIGSLTSKDTAPLCSLKDFYGNMLKYQSLYFLDLLETTKYFPKHYKINFRFGDIKDITDIAITKSRPICDNNDNNILLKLNKARHFIFVKDKKLFAEKKDILIGRNTVYQQHRKRFYEMYIDHPLCNLRCTSKRANNPLAWRAERMPRKDQLDYKFILCLEGNDVASNLKWVMSSNSLAVMTKPKYETWFMEGTLVAGKHYVEIKDDFSDLEEKLNYYINNPLEAAQISKNANDYVAQFKDNKKEELIQVLVLQKYFQR